MHHTKSAKEQEYATPDLRHKHGEISSKRDFCVLYKIVHRCGCAARWTADSCQEFIDET